MFHVSLLEQDTPKRELIEKIPKLDAGNNDNKEYKMGAIRDKAIYTNKSESGHLSGLYYLVA